MPDTLTAPPASTPGSSQPSQAAQTSITVSTLPRSIEGPAPAKPGSAREKAFAALQKRATGGTEAADVATRREGDGNAQRGEQSRSKPAREAEASEAHSADASAQSQEAGEQSTETTQDQSQAKTETTTKATETGKAKKTNPWKLLETERQNHAKTIQEYQEFKKKIPQADQIQTMVKRLQDAEALTKQLSDEIRYVNYEKSPEFKAQFEAPYQSAFNRAMEDLGEIVITDPTNQQQRRFGADDLAQFAFMSFTQAKQTAQQLFPDFADDAMRARHEIRGLWDKRQAAIKEWQEKGPQREQQRAHMSKRRSEQLNSQIKSVWEAANKETLEHQTRGEFFKPKEGDEEWNKRLESGFKLADETFAVNITDPRLTPAQRAEAVKKYAALRHRAAGWGPLRYENGQLKAKIASLEKKLSGYQSSTPGSAGGTTEGGRTANGASGSARDRAYAALQKMAH
jgi:hypothetical protein